MKKALEIARKCKGISKFVFTEQGDAIKKNGDEKKGKDAAY
jgi:hypothetical protein